MHNFANIYNNINYLRLLQTRYQDVKACVELDRGDLSTIIFSIYLNDLEKSIIITIMTTSVLK